MTIKVKKKFKPPFDEILFDALMKILPKDFFYKNRTVRSQYEKGFLEMKKTYPRLCFGRPMTDEEYDEAVILLTKDILAVELTEEEYQKSQQLLKEFYSTEDEIPFRNDAEAEIWDAIQEWKKKRFRRLRSSFNYACWGLFDLGIGMTIYFGCFYPVRVNFVEFLLFFLHMIINILLVMRIYYYSNRRKWGVIPMVMYSLSVRTL